MIHPSLEFLTQLDPSPAATFNIECYTDVPKGSDKPQPDPLVRRYPNKRIDEVKALLPELEALNDKGAAIHVARNQCTGQRTAKNITRVRGVHADMDGVTNDQLQTLISVLQPSIVVTSSGPENVHFYWQLSAGETMDTTQSKAINQTLVSYGADPAAVDVSRLLRLPGFKHMKYRAEGKTPTVSAEYSGPTYSTEEIRTAFPPKSASPAARVRATSPTKGHIQRGVEYADTKGISQAQLATIEKMLEAQERLLWTGDWQAVGQFGHQTYPSQSEADMALASSIVQICVQEGIPNNTIPQAVESLFSKSGLGARDKWRLRSDYRFRTIQKATSSLHTYTSNQSQVVLLLDSHGDVRNAKAFAQVTAGEFLYVTTKDCWLTWKSDRWVLCEKEEHTAKAKEVCRQILAAASSVFSTDQERGKRLIQEAVSAHSLSRITAMLKLAVSEPGVAVTSRELDSDPYLLGVENGMVDLRDGNHYFNRPDFKITRYCNASYEVNGNCDRWLTFLDEIFQGDSETIQSVQRLLGCTLLGLSNEEILIICYGHGANGKSVFSNVIHTIMGGYSITAAPSLLVARRPDDTGARNDLAALAGSRYVSINETQSGDRLDEQVVKMLAGREPISARFLHQEFFEFQPTFTPWLRTNHKPIVMGEDDGIWRRLVLLRFGKKFNEADQDPQLEKKLNAERNGILMWMIKGAQLYLQNGLALSPQMLAEFKAYRSESDLLGEFISDKTITGPALKIEQPFLYRHYRSWCFDAGVRTMSKKSFTQRLVERGYTEGKSGKNRFYMGIACELGLPYQTQEVVDEMDGMLANLGKSFTKDSFIEKPPNSYISRPTCPPQPCEGGEK